MIARLLVATLLAAAVYRTTYKTLPEKHRIRLLRFLIVAIVAFAIGDLRPLVTALVTRLGPSG